MSENLLYILSGERFSSLPLRGEGGRTEVRGPSEVRRDGGFPPTVSEGPHEGSLGDPESTVTNSRVNNGSLWMAALPIIATWREAFGRT